MKYVQLLYFASLAFCLVNANGLSRQDRKKIKDACIKRGASKSVCEDGVSKPAAVLSKKPYDYSGYLDTLGFRVPTFQGSKPYTVFWTKYDGKSLGPIAKALSTLDAKFYTSSNILPGAVMNDVARSLSVNFGDFWQSFSKWMAVNTPGPLAFWLTGGTEKGYFPSGRTPSVWQEYELPNLKAISVLVVLHLRGEEAKSSKSKCKNDRASYEKLKKINSKVDYICCELKAYDKYKGSPLFKKVAEGVQQILNGIIGELEADKMPNGCIDLKKYFAKDL